MDYSVLGIFLTITVCLISESSSAEFKSRGSSQARGSKRSSFWIGHDAPSTDELGPANERFSSRAKCVDIPQNMTLCRGIGYRQMRLPNLFEHETLQETIQQAASWSPLLSARCSSNTQLFLCSLFSPVCLDTPILPCRSLCLQVKQGCEQRMLSHGFPWPEMLNCSKFPSDNDLCISYKNDNKAVSVDNTSSMCSVCHETTSYQALTTSFCNSQFAAKVRPDESVVSGKDVKIIASRKTKYYKSVALSQPSRRRQTFYLHNGTQCDCFGFGNTGFKSLADHYILMGNKDRDQLSLTFILKVNGQSKDVRKALKNFKDPEFCKRSTREMETTTAKADMVESSADKHLNKKNTKRKDKAGMKEVVEAERSNRKSNKNRRRNPRKQALVQVESRKRAKKIKNGKGNKKEKINPDY